MEPGFIIRSQLCPKVESGFFLVLQYRWSYNSTYWRTVSSYWIHWRSMYILLFTYILHTYVAQMLYLLTSFRSFGLKTKWYLPALIQYLSCIAMFGITRKTFVLLNANSTSIMKIRVFKLLFVECIHEFIWYLIEQFLNIRNCLIWVEELSC